jgi:hypothetical protein
MRSPLLLLLIATQGALLVLVASPSAAQTGRALEGVRFDRAQDGWDVTVVFSSPIQVRRHSPESHGETVQVQIAPLAGSEAPVAPQTLSVPRSAPVPLESVGYEPEVADHPVLELRFSRAVDFEVREGRDLRSVVLRVASGTAARQAAASAPPAPPAGEDPRTAQLVEEGRRALTTSDFERAALILQEAAQRPESAQTPEALELLGMARERKGQLAHAKATYEEYLQRFPLGEGAARVRQRLEALVTARAVPPPRRRDPHSEQRAPAYDLEAFGSLYVGYRYESQILDPVGAETVDSSLYTDAFTETRLRVPSGIWRTHFSGGYLHQFAPSAGSDDTRVSSMFLSFEQPERGFVGSLGRRSQSDAGVLGRYDGIDLGYRGGPHWRLGVLGGLPVDSSRTNSFGEDRWLGGVHADLGTFFDTLDIGLYAVGQTASGLLDRAAIGGEIRVFQPGWYGALFFDYDFHFQDLNLIQFTGSWQVRPSTTLTALVDHRNSPFLTLRNALQGQSGGLDTLQGSLTDSQIESLARDNTGRVTTLDLGLSQGLLPRLQLALDFTASDFTGTDGSTGVPGFDGTGWEFSPSAQLIANDLLRTGDVGVASLRYFAGQGSDVVTIGLQAREPVTAGLRLNPRFFTIFRKSQTAEDLVALRPSLRLDQRVWKLNFDLEGGVEWSASLGGAPAGASNAPWGYFVTGGCRFDF